MQTTDLIIYRLNLGNLSRIYIYMTDDELERIAIQVEHLPPDEAQVEYHCDAWVSLGWTKGNCGCNSKAGNIAQAALNPQQGDRTLPASGEGNLENVE